MTLVGLDTASKTVGLRKGLGFDTSLFRHSQINRGDMSAKETLAKAYGNVPHDVGLILDLDINVFRGFKYYYLKLIRFITR